MKKHLLLVPFALATFQATVAQQVHKMDFTLRHYLAKEHAPNEEVDLFIHGEEELVARAVRNVGGRVKLSRPGLVSVRVPAARVAELSNEVAVQHFEFRMDRGQLMNDSMRVKNRVNWVHQGLAPLPQGYDGTGVVLGFIDSGLDLNHPDFRDENDQSRVYRYWDQVPPPSVASPQPYGYGREWTQAQLNSGGPIPTEPANLYGHGSTVAGTGAGNGLANGRHKGVAPKADMIIVATNFAMPNWTSTVADGVAYIIEQAEALGKPAVINASLGSYLGSHDGKDAAALFIEDLLNAQGGRAMVSASGNTHSSWPYHLRTDVDADTSFTWFYYNPNLFGVGGVFFEAWSDVVDFNDVRFAIGADRGSPSVLFRGRTPYHTVNDIIDQTVVDTLWSDLGNELAIVQYYAEQRGDQYQLQVFLDQPDSNNMRFRFETTGQGKFDIWSSSNFGLSDMWETGPLPGTTQSAEHYVLPDRNKHMVDSWACLPNVLTVANYCNEVAYIDYAGNPQTVDGTEGDISPNSSAGPTRDDRLKPDIAATGDITFTAAPLDAIQAIITTQNGWKVDPGGMHVRNGGTSMASPVVAGTVALFLQRCPQATALEIVEAVHANARGDGFTGALPNNRWGMGKLDAFNTVLNKHQLQVASTTICEGTPMEVAYPDHFASAVWSNGEETTGPLLHEADGPLSAVLTAPSGCIGYTDTLLFDVVPVPATPVISANGSELTSSIGPGYQWYLDGDALLGANDQVLTALVTGSYAVEVIDANGCSAISDPVAVVVTGLVEQVSGVLRLWPSPTRALLNVALPAISGPVDLRIHAADGKLVRQERRAASGEVLAVDVSGLPAGTFMLTLATQDGSWSQRFVKMP